MKTCIYIYVDTTSILPYLFNSCIQQVIGHTSRYEEVSRVGGAEAVLSIGFTDTPVQGGVGSGGVRIMTDSFE